MVEVRQVVELQAHAKQEELLKHAFRLTRNFIKFICTLKTNIFEKSLNFPISSEDKKDEKYGGDCFFEVGFLFDLVEEFSKLFVH